MINKIPVNLNMRKREHSPSPNSADKSALKKTSKNTQSAIVNNSEITMTKPAEINFCGLPSSKINNFYKSEKLKKVLEFAERQPLVFSAAFALLLTCIFRPAAIMSLPGDKNKDDKKYASAHSIASGIIGFVISSIIFTPISNAIKKLGDNPSQYIKNNNSYLKDENLFKIAKVYLDRSPDIITAIPKGILTVALIPPILKHVFGMEKKKSSSKTETLSTLNFASTKNSSVHKTFQGIIGGTN